jgi:hypothetical protein
MARNTAVGTPVEVTDVCLDDLPRVLPVHPESFAGVVVDLYRRGVGECLPALVQGLPAGTGADLQARHAGLLCAQRGPPHCGLRCRPPQAPVGGSAGCPAWVAVNLLLMVAASHGSSRYVSAAFRPLRHAGRGIRCRWDVREVTAAGTRAAGTRE